MNPINIIQRIHPAVNAWCHAPMEIQDTRRTRLRLAIKDLAGDNLTALANRAGKPPSQFSDVLSGRKPFGEKLARDIELRLGLPQGWLDESTTTYRDAKPRGPAPAMPPVTADELNLLTVYRTADAEAKEVIREQAEQIAKLSKKRRRR